MAFRAVATNCEPNVFTQLAWWVGLFQALWSPEIVYISINMTICRMISDVLWIILKLVAKNKHSYYHFWLCFKEWSA